MPSRVPADSSDSTVSALLARTRKSFCKPWSAVTVRMCLTTAVDSTASIIWGVIGPQEMFSYGKTYKWVYVFALD
jgi:hypothetical protein